MRSRSRAAHKGPRMFRGHDFSRLTQEITPPMMTASLVCDNKDCERGTEP